MLASASIPNADECAPKAAPKTPIYGMRKPFSVVSRIAPSAARRSAKGSLEPVGFSSIVQKPASVSTLSASATQTLTGADGQASAGPCGD